MVLSISTTEAFWWPDEATVSVALALFGLQPGDLRSALLSFADDTDPSVSRYTEAIAGNLAHHLAQVLVRSRLLITTHPAANRYTSEMAHNADLVIAQPNTEQRLFFEIEFRPNFEKDLVKFRVGHNSGRLAAGILLVATDRRSIRGSYTTMPEFDGVVRMIGQFRPDHPLLVLGMGLTLVHNTTSA